jgi:hypothetical protein
MTCLICYYSVTNDKISCSDPNCLSKICTDCAVSLVNFSHKENEIPRCPNSSCRQELLYSEIKKLGEPTLNLYYETCVNSLKLEKHNDIESKINQKKIVEKIREEKIKFINTQFPVAVSLTIKYALSSKLNKITKKNSIYMNNILKSSNKKCMNLFCNEKLDDELYCSLCDIKFCKFCEKKLTKGHICKQEDIDSVTFIENLVKCPKCLFPVIRSYGCNNITCSICKTNFNYISGLISQAGNHDNSPALNINSSSSINSIVNTIKPSDHYKDDYDMSIIKLLCLIEEKSPVNYSFDNVLKSLENVVKNGFNNILGKRVCLSYERYKVYLVNQKKYSKAMNVIKENHDNKTLDENILKKILYIL